MERGGGRTVGDEGGNVVDDFDGLGIGVGTRVLVVQAVDVGHEEQEVGVHHGGGDGGEGVVVAELDLGDGQRVVLVDDGDDSHVEELVDGVLGIEIS